MSKHTAIRIRELIKIPPKVLRDKYKTDSYILFEDNLVVFMRARDIILMRYVLEVLKDYDVVAIPSTYAITHFYVNGMFVNKTINNCFSVIEENIVKKLLLPNNKLKYIAELHLKMFQVNNLIYNELGCGNLRYCTSSNILDYLEVQMKPKLLEAMAEVSISKDKKSIDAAHQTLDNLLTSDPSLKDNPISKAYVSNMINSNQVKQVLGPRGFGTEIDGSIFKHPIASSFTLGMDSIYDMAVESRSGAKALYISNISIRDSEYLAREIQLVVMTIERIHFEDCGNTNYSPWYIKPKTDLDKADLPNLVGKRFYNPETKKEEILTKNHTHLEGKTVQLRSVQECKHLDKNGICMACFGEFAYNLYPHTAVGHQCAATISQMITQNLLSTKHITTSATGTDIHLSDSASKFLMTQRKEFLTFKSIIKRYKKVTLSVNQREMFGIKDIRNTDEIIKLDPERVTRINTMLLTVTSKNNVQEQIVIDVKQSSKVYGYFTSEFLEHIISNNVLNNQDQYEIDVTNWTTGVPILKYPQVEFNFLDLAKEIKKLLKTMPLNNKLVSLETPESMLQKLFSLVNTKLNINIVLLEVIIYAFTIISLKQNNFNLARGKKYKEVADIKRIMPRRSLGGAYAWENITKTILDPLALTSKNRINHPLDVLIRPNETIMDYYGNLN